MFDEIKEYRLTLTVKNNLILKRIEDLGYTSINKFCLENEIQYPYLLNLINMKISPIDCRGRWIKTVLRLCVKFNCNGEELFTDNQMDAHFSTNKITIGMKESEAIFCMKNNFVLEEKFSPENLLIEDKRREILNELMEVLTEKQKKVINMRMEEKTFQEISKKLGVCTQRIRKVEYAAWKRMKDRAIRNNINIGDFL